MVASTNKGLQKRMIRLEETVEKNDIRINQKKTKAIRTNRARRKSVTISINGNIL